MQDTDKAFTGSIPALYDRHLGPVLFRPYAADLADRLAGFRGRLLETACGTGIVTGALADAFPEAEITATDLNPPMLAFAQQEVRTPNVSWRQADALALPFDDASFDAIVCQFGAMFFPDRVAGYREARRVLRPGGRFLFNVWGSVPENPIVAILVRTVAACFPSDPPGFLERTPYGYHDPDRIRADLRAAGWDEVHIATVTLRVPVASARDFATGLCMGSPLRTEIEARDASRLEEVTDAAAEAIEAEFGTGGFDAKLQALVIAAYA